MSDVKKILLVQKPTAVDVRVLTTFAKFGYDVRYMFYPEHLKRKIGNAEGICHALGRKGLSKVDVSTIEGLDQYAHLKNCPQYARDIYEDVFKDAILEPVCGLFEGLEDCPEKLPILVYDDIVKQVMAIGKMLSVAQALSAQGHEVSIYHPPNRVLSRVLTKDLSGFENVYPAPLSWMWSVVSGTSQVFGLSWRVVQKLLSVARSRKASARQETSASIRADNYDGQACNNVVYFPHQGVAYGNLFLKDHFYADDPQSPFHPSRILHVELHSAPGEDSMRYYRDAGIPMTVLAMGLRANVNTLRILISAWGPIWQATHSIRLFPDRWFALELLWRSYLSFLRSWLNTDAIKEARLALVGFDYLFPTGLALALQARGIHVAAVQERFIHVFDNLFHPVFDTYFISGEAVRRRLTENPFHHVEDMPVIGLVRTALIEADRGVDEEKQQGQKIVLVLDYHSDPDPLADKANPLVSWRSNRDFYNDILTLAAQHPDVRFIIRGKDDAWCSIPYFSDVLAAMEQSGNVEVNRQYDQMNVSYMLAAKADLIIARQTSLGDEAMACDIPVLFHDYTCMRSSYVSDVCDYGGYPVFVHGFEELALRVDDVLSDREYMSPDAFRKMRKELFGVPSGDVKASLIAHLKTILEKAGGRA